MGSIDSVSLRPVLLAGGSGTRLWPLSRRAFPKQFVPLLGKESLFQATLERLEGIVHLPPFVVCNEVHRFLVAEEIRRAGVLASSILLEPVCRNTGPAIALAALEAVAGGEDPILLVLPSDHAIPEATEFAAAAEEANKGALVSFGIRPTAPRTGYGYIQAGPGTGVRSVEAFVEKPDHDKAERYLQSGQHFWNSGMFVFRASACLEEFERLAPETLAAVRAAHAGRMGDHDFLRFDPNAFAAAAAESIDRLVMEHTHRAVMVPFDSYWNDVGSWHTLWDAGVAAGEADAFNNVTRSDVIATDIAGCYLQSTHRLVAAVGLRDCVVVETADAVNSPGTPFRAYRTKASEIARIRGTTSGS